MKSEEKSPAAVKKARIAGIDIGGTKVHILDSQSTKLHRYATSDFSDLYGLLAAYFTKIGTRPELISIAMAGPRNDETGEIRMTNASWPVFNPTEANERYPGTTFITAHDMTAVAAAAVYEPSLDIIHLKQGSSLPHGPKLVVTISTGVGVCVAIWDEHSKRYIFFSGEAGHIGFQPSAEAEYRHLQHLSNKYDHPSVELAISGKYGFENWLEHSPELQDSPKLSQALSRALKDDRPVGAVLLAFATGGQGKAQSAAAAILNNMGALVGSVLAEFALAYKATGGIYLTGSVALGLSEYWAEQTHFSQAFNRHGTFDHAPWLEDMLAAIPILLMSDSLVAARGSLALARKWLEEIA